MKNEAGCNRWLARGQHWNWCGETDMGQGPPYLCTECGGTLKLETNTRRLALIGDGAQEPQPLARKPSRDQLPDV